MSLERPASDSNISYTMHNKMAAARSSGLGLPFPERPEDVPDWVRRRGEMSRRAPKPVEQEEHYIPRALPMGVYHELDAGPAVLLGAEDESLVHAFEARGKGEERSWVPRRTRDEDGASERSIEGVLSGPKRTNTGTDEEELATVLALSMHVN